MEAHILFNLDITYFDTKIVTFSENRKCLHGKYYFCNSDK